MGVGKKRVWKPLDKLNSKVSESRILIQRNSIECVLNTRKFNYMDEERKCFVVYTVKD